MGDFAERAAEWLNGYDTGLSSKAIFHYMSLGIKGGSTPCDPADLGRCLRLLERFPEWKVRMPEMAAVSPSWSRLMPHWDAIVASFIEEAGGSVPSPHANWSAKRTYDMMQTALYKQAA